MGTGREGERERVRASLWEAEKEGERGERESPPQYSRSDFRAEADPTGFVYNGLLMV